ncbi:putative surface antigen protein [Escherichia coli DEC2E]|nr:putative surface antigen protein [Escherichia coli DEC2E]
MNKSMLAGIGIGVAAALGVAAVASLNVFERGPQYAQVVSATPIKETVKTPRQECRNVTVTHRRPVQDENRITGSVLGAVAGGVIGHQFGGGRGKDVATVVGALGVDMQVTRSRALSRKAILTRLRNSVVKRCMTSQKKCSVMM